MLNDIKVNYGNTYAVAHSRDYQKGKSFNFAGEWKQGCHYFNDAYCADFVTYGPALLACTKSHLASRDTEPSNLIYNNDGICIGVRSLYWEFVLAGYSGNAFTNADKAKLDGLNIKYDSTENWTNARGYVPQKGEIVIYSDYKTIEIDGQMVQIPGIKIGSGNGYVQDLAFTDEDTRQALLDHINNGVCHITAEERKRWNNKLNVTDTEEVVDDTLIFNRN